MADETPAAATEDKTVLEKTGDAIAGAGTAVKDGALTAGTAVKDAAKTVLDHTVLDMSPHGTNVDGFSNLDGKLAEDVAAGVKKQAQADNVR